VLVAATSLSVSANPSSTKAPSPGKSEHPLVLPVCGALASCTAEMFTLPIDVAKVRMQIASAPQGILGTISTVARSDGPAALFSGIAPALLRQASYSGIKMCLYEPIRDAVRKRTAGGGGNKDLRLWQMILAGGLAGAIGTFLTSPTDLIKIRMQSGSTSYDGLVQAFVSVITTGGVLALWEGWQANVQRSFIVNAAELATYDRFKRKLLRLRWLKDGLLVHAFASSLAGFVSAVFSTPVDRAKTLLMAEGSAHGSTVFACLVLMAQRGGVAGLYQGFLATWVRNGPWAFIFFVCFEQYRAIAVRLTSRMQQVELESQPQAQ
jgi:hypothetical protein